MTSRYFESARPRLFGHRGNSADFPENTLPAFADAIAAGLPYLELDIRATLDGHVVVLHDASLLRTCGVDREITAMPLDEVQRLDAGATFTPDEGRSYPHRGTGIRIPTLAETLQAFPDAFFNIEIKQEAPAMEEMTLEVIRNAGMEERVLLAAESDAIMKRLRPLCGTRNIPTSLSYGELVTFFGWLQTGGRESYRPPAQALQIPECYEGQTLVTAQSVAAAHALGMEVHVWTVNDPADMERLLTMGVDGLMSDRPRLLRDTCGTKLSEDH